MAKKELRIYVELNGDVKKRFLKIKEHTGLINNTEVLRFIINEYRDQKGGLAFGSELAEDSK